MEDLRFGPGDILEGDYWPEPVRVLTVNQVGNLTRLEVVGTESGRFYGETWLGRSDLASLKVQAPQGFTFSGDGEAAFLALEARRIRLAHLFDPLQAVHTSQVDPLPHQIDAVYHHMLRQARLRFLLADDPGAGKTIMAGLLLKELKYRSLVERTLIVVPGHLIDQWLREMRERFWETFRVVNRAAVKGSWRENLWRSHPQLITSMDFAKQEDVLTSLAEADWDLVIVDEAHKLSAWRYGDKTKKTQRYRLGEVLSRTSRFLLFLTATPRNKTGWDIYHQIKLFHPDDKTDLPIDPQDLKKYFQMMDRKERKLQDLLPNILIRRTRHHILRWYGYDSETHQRVDPSRHRDYLTGKRRAYIIVGGRHQFFPKKALEPNRPSAFLHYLPLVPPA